MRKFTKKTVVVATGVVIVLAGSGVAFAYWTAGGTGTGTAATGTNVAITAVQTSTVSAMKPGDLAQPLNGNFSNTNTSPVYVTSVTASITGVAGGAGSCDATDYTLATPIMSVNAEVSAGTAQGAWTGATIKFNNKASVNQDGCKGATVTLTYTII